MPWERAGMEIKMDIISELNGKRILIWVTAEKERRQSTFCRDA